MHPNLAAIYELGERDGHPFIAMEYVDGQTLEAVRRDGLMPLERALDIALQTAAALAAAHGAGLRTVTSSRATSW